MAENERIIPISLSEEMKTAYIDYSMSVIVSRAIPDVRDGLKPVHRRVLFGMHELGLQPSKSYKKSARIVGEVLGKYHPHGDGSVYDAMVRMAQEWSLRYPLVDGQGNFGSVDGDSPAAMRYTEARLKKMSEDILSDIEKETVDFNLNFDDSLEEPSVLPSRIPTLLINGASGIAVGMATNILPHNITEVINGMIAYIENNDITIDELMKFVTAPDFPTGGTIYGYEGVREGFKTGRGRVVVRGKVRIEEEGKKPQLIITEIPYQVNKSVLIQKTANLVNDKKIDGITDIRDESDRTGMRIVIDLRRDAIPNVVINRLYQYTQLQTSYGVNNVALVKGRPQTLNLKDMILHFVEFRHEVVVRRTQYELRKAEERAHILEGLIIASDNIDEVIALIRSSKNAEEAREKLIAAFELSDLQARAIVEMRLRQLTGLEQDKLRTEYEELMKTISRLQAILASKDMRMDLIKNELFEVQEKYGDERKTNIEFAGGDINMEDLIPNERVVVTISHLGYIKRTPSIEYKQQRRGGKGSKGATTRNEDFTEHMILATTHNYMLFFTEKGKLFWLKVYEIPEGSKTGKGRAIQNIIQLPNDDKVLAYIPIKDLKDEEFLDSHFIMFVSKKGIVKKTAVRKYSRPRSSGLNAITIKDGDELCEVKLTNGNSEILIASRKGKAIRFEETNVRAMGRTATGVKGITLAGKEDAVVGMVCIDKDDKESSVMVVSEQGYGKRTMLDDEDGEAVYRITKRGGKGVKTLNVTDKTGDMIALKSVKDEDEMMIINKSGIAIRMGLTNIRVMGRATQGVRLITLKEGDEIAAVAKIANDPDDLEDVDGIIPNLDDEHEDMSAGDSDDSPDHTEEEE